MHAQQKKACKAEVQYQHTHKVSHSGGGGAWMGQAHPSSYRVFFTLPTKTSNVIPLWGTPPPLINEAPHPPPSEKQTTPMET